MELFQKKSQLPRRRKTLQVKVRNMHIGSDYPIAVQSMTDTSTEDVRMTVSQITELYNVGSELVRLAIPNVASAKSVVNIRKELNELGYDIPLVGDFHYNGHKLLAEVNGCAASLDKLRINPGNAGSKHDNDENFKTFIKIAKDYNKPIRIGVNYGSIDRDILTKLTDANARQKVPMPINAVAVEAVVESAVHAVDKAVEYGLEPNMIIVSAKLSDVNSTVTAYEALAERIKQPLHIGLTEAGVGLKGIVSTSVALSALLAEGIGDTIRASLTPLQNGRTEEVKVCQNVLQALELRQFAPSITSCPGCGRTNSTSYKNLAADITRYLEKRLPEWRRLGYSGMEKMIVAVMGCVVNGPGESSHANIGISLPGSGENPICTIYENGKVKESVRESNAYNAFVASIEDYVKRTYGRLNTKGISS
ncbi:MAG: flavodoxin-dependent (E)-4-hydroxy-3-methylbut-2-enyl-diphosphate synthase [Candidatus Marsarchaeota archaeon]|nr:flavodoxin-dependent (E)-4-hydroxy-3-methylbut-2-enyl-diphosphate synthase [Candidatus Marsarchaeota archaeon]